MRAMRVTFVVVLSITTLLMVSVSASINLSLSRELPHQLQLARSLAGLRLRRDPAAATKTISQERGIILCMNNVTLTMGLSLIRDLRCHGNDEHIQVYHCFPDEMPDDTRSLLLAADDKLKITDVCTAMVESGKISAELATHFRSWWIKPLAVYHTTIKEVLLLDIDDIFMRDPAVLRTTPGYLSTGMTFFFDRVIPGDEYFNKNVSGTQYLELLINEFDYTAFGIKGPVGPSEYLQTTFAFKGETIHEQDSSIVAIDKSRAGAALEVLLFLITKQHVERAYSMVDKESFWIAYELAHVPYFFSPWGVGVISSSTNRDVEAHNDSLCGNIAQYMPLENDTSEFLYLNAEALLDPFPMGIEGGRTAAPNLLFNINPTHITPRQRRRSVGQTATGYEGVMMMECLAGFGSTPLPAKFGPLLLRRRLLLWHRNGHHERAQLVPPDPHPGRRVAVAVGKCKQFLAHNEPSSYRLENAPLPLDNLLCCDPLVYRSDPFHYSHNRFTCTPPRLDFTPLVVVIIRSTLDGSMRVCDGVVARGYQQHE